MDGKTDPLDMTVDIISAFVSNNSVPASELPGLIKSVYSTLNSISAGEEIKPEARKEPAVSVKKSLGTDFIICLEDGRKFKSLKRHLRTKYAMSPEEYRQKWNLPKDYPMVAPSYSAARSNLAKEMGLGQGGRQATAAKTPAKAPGTRARAKT